MIKDIIMRDKGLRVITPQRTAGTPLKVLERELIDKLSPVLNRLDQTSFDYPTGERRDL